MIMKRAKAKVIDHTSFTFLGEDGKLATVSAQGKDQVELARCIFDVAGDTGKISAAAARCLFTDSRHHIAISLSRAFKLSGFSAWGNIRPTSLHPLAAQRLKKQFGLVRVVEETRSGVLLP